MLVSWRISGPIKSYYCWEGNTSEEEIVLKLFNIIKSLI